MEEYFFFFQLSLIKIHDGIGQTAYRQTHRRLIIHSIYDGWVCIPAVYHQHGLIFVLNPYSLLYYTQKKYWKNNLNME